MKRTFVTLFAVVLLSSAAFAQLEKGTMLAGGEFGLELNTNKSKYRNQTTTNSKSTSFTLEPRFGYFVIDNLAIGGEISLTSSVSKDELDGDKTTDNSFAIGPFVRYYFPAKIFLEGQYSAGFANTKYSNSNEKDKYNLGGWSLASGYAIFLNDNVAVEPMLGFQSVSYKNKTDGEAEWKNVNAGMFFRVGFQIYLR